MRNNRNNLSIIKENNSKGILENEADDSKSNKSNLSIFKSTKYDKENPFKNNHLHNDTQQKENNEKKIFDTNNLVYESLPMLNKEENSENYSNSLINTATLNINRSPNKKLSIIKTTNLENKNKEHLRLSPVKHSSLKMTKNQEELFKRLHKNEKKEENTIEKENIQKNYENINDISYIPEYILNEHIKYNGKIDKVRLYQHFREYWKATPIINKDYKYCDLNKKEDNYMIHDENEEISKERRIFLRKMKNIRKPITYYKKF